MSELNEWVGRRITGLVIAYDGTWLEKREGVVESVVAADEYGNVLQVRLGEFWGQVSPLWEEMGPWETPLVGGNNESGYEFQIDLI